MKPKIKKIVLTVFICLLLSGCNNRFYLTTPLYGKKVQQNLVLEKNVYKKITIYKGFEKCDIAFAQKNNKGIVALFVLYSPRSKRLTSFISPWKIQVDKYVVFVKKKNKLKIYKIKWPEKWVGLVPDKFYWIKDNLKVNLNSEIELEFNQNGDIKKGKEYIE